MPKVSLPLKQAINSPYRLPNPKPNPFVENNQSIQSNTLLESSLLLGKMTYLSKSLPPPEYSSICSLLRSMPVSTTAHHTKSLCIIHSDRILSHIPRSIGLIGLLKLAPQIALAKNFTDESDGIRIAFIIDMALLLICRKVKASFLYQVCFYEKQIEDSFGARLTKDAWDSRVSVFSVSFWAKMIDYRMIDFTRLALAVHQLAALNPDMCISPKGSDLLLLFLHGIATEAHFCEGNLRFLQSLNANMAVILSEKLSPLSIENRHFIYTTLKNWPDTDLLKKVTSGRHLIFICDIISEIESIWMVIQNELKERRIELGDYDAQQLRYRILTGIVSLSENAVLQVIELLSQKAEERSANLAELLLVLAQLSGDPDCFKHLQLVSPITETRGDNKSSEVSHGGLFKLRGRHDKGEVPEVLQLVYTT